MDKKINLFRLNLTLIVTLVAGFDCLLAQAKISPIDFSYAGYANGDAPPLVPDVVSIHPSNGDDTKRVQAAINYLAGRPLQQNGFRGGLRFSQGVFHIAGQLHVIGDGIFLRGDPKGTTIIATGKGRRAIIDAGNSEPPAGVITIKVSDETVEVGSRQLTLETVQGLNKGDHVIVTRPGSKEWIASAGIKLERLWTAGSRDIVWDRIIEDINVSAKQITLDAPITTAIESRFGGASVTKVEINRVIKHAGFENLILQSEFNHSNSKDEDHAWFGIHLDNIEDVWISKIKGRHFASSVINAGPRARRVTIEDCSSEKPVSEIGGYRRLSFFIEGQQVLVKNCKADSSVNAFAVGLMSAGPNVFLKCKATHALGASGAYESWASGVLYEDVTIENAALNLAYDSARTQEAGWTAANSVAWNCKATELLIKGSFSAPNVAMNSPESLYELQYEKRTGRVPSKNAQKVTKDVLLKAGIKEFTTKDIPVEKLLKAVVKPLQIVNGRYVISGKVVWGGAVSDGWWLGFVSPAKALDGGVSITRFVPGRIGPGLTEDLPQLAARVVKQGTLFYQSGPYGLWYDRRRDEHSIKERTDGNVWPAFLEQPWIRSGQGKAWDGLSKYDVSRFNSWYFARLSEFARLSDQHGFVLYHHVYNNHNLVEVPPHWVDFPWRPANNINQTNLPEPPPFINNKIHVANEFYDVTDANRRKLHHDYITHVLDQIGFTQNLILCAGFQFFGPLEFQQFFQRTVAEWEKKNHHSVRIVLGTSKDITDAILEDPQLSRQVAVIDMRYWQYLADGTLWAPQGGKNLAFREYVTMQFGTSLDFPKATTPEQAYRQVREYRDKYPDKAIVAWHNEVGPIPALMAGASQVLMLNPAAGHRQGRIIDFNPLDSFIREHLSISLMNMLPKDGVLNNEKQNWVLADKGYDNILIYSLPKQQIQLVQNIQDKSFTAIWLDPRTGKTQPAQLPDKLLKGTIISKPTEENWLLLLVNENR